MASGFSKFRNEVVSTALRRARIIQGLYYTTDRYNNAVTNGSSVDLLLQTGEFPIHLRQTASAGGQGEFRLFEGTTFSNAGTALPVYNHNRNSSRPATVLSSFAPTITLVGTELDVLFMPGGAGGNSVGGQGDFDAEWVLAPNTNYLIRFTNTSGNTQPVHVHAEWFEELGG